MEAVTLSEAQIYVGTYAKYNNGSIFGKWLDLSDYSDKNEFFGSVPGTSQGRARPGIYVSGLRECTRKPDFRKLVI